MAAEPCLWRWQLESLSTQVRPDRPCQPPEEKNRSRQRVICVPLWFFFTSWSLHWPPKWGEEVETGTGVESRGKYRGKHTSAVTADLFLVLKWLWAVSESLLYFPVTVFLISSLVDSRRSLAYKNAKVIISEIVKTRNIRRSRKRSDAAFVKQHIDA